jgi:hypothetical protein
MHWHKVHGHGIDRPRAEAVNFWKKFGNCFANLLSVEESASNSDLRLMPLINLHYSCFNRPRSWYNNMHAYAANDWIYIRDHQDNSTYWPWLWHRTDLRNKNHVEITVEIDPLEALVENCATRTRLSKTEFWNSPDRKSPYLIIVLISCINVAIDTLQCNQGISRCNNFYTVATITKSNATTKFRGNTYTIDKSQCNQGIPRFNSSEVVRIMTFLRVHIMCPGFSTDA